MLIKNRIKEHREILVRLHQKRDNVIDALDRIDERIKHHEIAVDNLIKKDAKIEYDRLRNPKIN